MTMKYQIQHVIVDWHGAGVKYNMDSFEISCEVTVRRTSSVKHWYKVD